VPRRSKLPLSTGTSTKHTASLLESVYEILYCRKTRTRVTHSLSGGFFRLFVCLFSICGRCALNNFLSCMITVSFYWWKRESDTLYNVFGKRPRTFRIVLYFAGYIRYITISLSFFYIQRVHVQHVYRKNLQSLFMNVLRYEHVRGLFGNY
jgi:hypothetical protein